MLFYYTLKLDAYKSQKQPYDGTDKCVIFSTVPFVTPCREIIIIIIKKKNNNNNNTNADVYGAVIMAKLLRKFTRFI